MYRPPSEAFEARFTKWEPEEVSGMVSVNRVKFPLMLLKAQSSIPARPAINDASPIPTILHIRCTDTYAQ